MLLSRTFGSKIGARNHPDKHPLDVLLVRVEDGDAPNFARHLRRRDPADGASADDEDAGLYHSLSGIDRAITVHYPSPVVPLPLRGL